MSKIILTVDDSRTMRDMLNFALADAGFRVTQAVDGLHGLEMLRGEETPHVIVTDLNMPKLDGFGFIEAVRRDARFRAIPILVLTTESDGERRTAPARPAPPAGSSSPSIQSSSSTLFDASRLELSRRPKRLDTMATIKQTFFQECEEQLAELESGLLAMNEGFVDPETVNAVFRAVHSIKGGAGAFRLDDLVR